MNPDDGVVDDREFRGVDDPWVNACRMVRLTTSDPDQRNMDELTRLLEECAKDAYARRDKLCPTCAWWQAEMCLNSKLKNHSNGCNRYE